MSDTTATTFALAPLLREALAGRGEQEDFDEALLRALKAHGHQEAPTLLAAVNQVLEQEGQRRGEAREQVIARLAGEEQGPEISFHRGAVTTTVTKSFTVRAGGKEYHSLEELPPELRDAVAQALPNAARKARVKVTVARTGCALPLFGALVGLVLFFGLLRP